MPPSPKKLPAAKSHNPLTTAIKSLDFDPSQDKYKITGAGGIATVHVQKSTGEVYTVHVNGVAFQQFTAFDPSKLTVQERRALEYDLVKNKKLTQTETADLLGVSQSLVAKDLKIIESQQ